MEKILDLSLRQSEKIENSFNSGQFLNKNLHNSSQSLEKFVLSLEENIQKIEDKINEFPNEYKNEFKKAFAEYDHSIKHYFLTVLNHEINKINISLSEPLSKRILYELKSYQHWLKCYTKRNLARLVIPGIRLSLRYPFIKYIVLFCLKNNPSMTSRIRQFAINRKIIILNDSNSEEHLSEQPHHFYLMTPYSKKIFHQLKLAFDIKYQNIHKES